MSDDDEKTRRDFLFVATGAAGAVTTGAVVWPLIDQWSPSADVLALATIKVDISEVAEGSQITVKWRGKPVFIRHRTDEEIAAARDVGLGDLPDQASRNANDDSADADDQNRSIDPDGKWLVMLGVCTHLGCVPLGDGAGEFGGWFCPCHGSHYDTSGRIRKGPAPENLPVPTASFVDETTLQLG
ncbi:MAG: ubiquinol-cytochrome c reductase iron-sulfur subunit [Pseudomonadota bacterium]